MDKKVMIICGCWYPKPMPVTICAINVIRELQASGYEVIVCSLAEDMDARGEKIDEGVKIYQRLPLLDQRIMYRADKSNNKLLYFIGMLMSRVHSMLLLPFYPCDALYLYSIWSKEIQEIMKREEIDNIISFENPTEASWTAYFIKKKNLNYKWINYQIDCGADTEEGSSFYFIRKLLQKKVDKAYKKMMRFADYNIIMNGHIEHYLKNGFIDEQINIKEFDVPLIKHTSTYKQKKISKFDNWVYAGALTAEWYNPTVLIDFFMAYMKINENATLTIWGQADDKTKSILDNAEKISKGRIIYNGYVPHYIVQEKIENADVLVYYMSEMKKSVSGKFFEYISYAKPVVFISPGKGDVNEKYVNKYQYGMSVSKNSLVEQQAICVAEFLKKIENDVIDVEKSKFCFKDNDPKEAAKFIDSIFVKKEGVIDGDYTCSKE